MDAADARGRDLLADPARRRLFFRWPKVTLVAGFLLPPPWRPTVIAGSLLVMAGACLANARRCGRLHCFLTGPFYLAMAAVSVAYGLGWLPRVGRGWLAIGLAVLVGGSLLATLPERFWGEYR